MLVIPFLPMIRLVLHGPYLSYLSSLGVFQMPRKGPDQSKSSALGYEDSSCSSAIPHLTGAALSEGQTVLVLAQSALHCSQANVDPIPSLTVNSYFLTSWGRG